MIYIDFHTHKLPELEGTYLKIFDSNNLIKEIYLSIGVHPWSLKNDQNFNENLFIEMKYKFNETYYALGETGIDRHFKKDIPIEWQLELLNQHYQMAQTKKVPMILHIVHAHDVFLKFLKKNYKSDIPLVIHDYRGGNTETKKYLDFPIYFSFGKSLKGTTSKTPEIIQKLSFDRFFLETDGSDEVTIQEVYELTAKILKISLNDLENKQLENLSKLFPRLKF